MSDLTHARQLGGAENLVAESRSAYRVSTIAAFAVVAFLLALIAIFSSHEYDW
jgi:hypothetical protein